MDLIYIDNIRESISRYPTVIFRPTTENYNFIEIENDLLNNALNEIEIKCKLNLDIFTACEKVLFLLFINHYKNGFPS
jgi:hypothetical protein